MAYVSVSRDIFIDVLRIYHAAVPQHYSLLLFHELLVFVGYGVFLRDLLFNEVILDNLLDLVSCTLTYLVMPPSSS